jgi:NADPH2:quinone reductase
MPDVLSFEQGACLGIPALTAWRAVHLDPPAPGEWVLVSGGGGAVGHYAVQFAKLLGARVIATAGSPRTLEHARQAGAEHVFDYRDDRLEEQVLQLTGGLGVARIVEVEFGLNVARLAKMVRQEGVVFVYGSAAAMAPQIPVQGLMVRGVTLHFRSVYLMPAQVRQAAIADIHRLAGLGALQHAVGRVYPLAEIAAAHEAVEKRSHPPRRVRKPQCCARSHAAGARHP